TKAVPPRHLRRNAEQGVQFHATAVADLTSDRHGRLLGGGAEAGELTALPDLSTLTVLPWDTRTAFAFCELYHRDDHPLRPGAASGVDVRALLARRMEEFTGSTGLELRSGCEPEMSWIDPRRAPWKRPGLAPNYHLGELEANRGILTKVLEYGHALGLDMIEGDYEDDHQLELNWMYDRADRTADRLVLYRLLCRQVGRELGVTATFMPKPFPGVMGNGCHHNLSLWRGEENVLADAGTRALHVTDTARHAIGGLLEHAAGSMAVYAPTVNSYKRFWDTGLFAPNRVDWGLDNKTCTVRVSASGRLELKLPDASVNPYLSHSVVLACLEDGLARRVDPGPPSTADAADAAMPDDDTATPRFRPLPLTLGDALRAMAEDTVVTGALGEELSALFLEYKADEWARACGAVTDWDRDMYLEFLP
ncbi:MAG: glutamine synthetase family protein, partial [Phycicoccus sp.]